MCPVLPLPDLEKHWNLQQPTVVVGTTELLLEPLRKLHILMQRHN